MQKCEASFLKICFFCAYQRVCTYREIRVYLTVVTGSVGAYARQRRELTRKRVLKNSLRYSYSLLLVLKELLSII
jgi:hypothetical protein